MAIPGITPSSRTQLSGMINQIGGGANRLMGMPTPGTNDIRTMYKGLEGAPPVGLPGGGVLGAGNPLQRYIQQEVPAATLPMYQGETGRKLGLAGVAGGAGQLQASAQEADTQYQQQLKSQLQDLMFGLGYNKNTQLAGGSTFALLAQMLGI